MSQPEKKTGASPDEAGQMTGRCRHAAGLGPRRGGPAWSFSSGLRGRLRSRRIVGLCAASSGPDCGSIRDVLSVARFVSALALKEVVHDIDCRFFLGDRNGFTAGPRYDRRGSRTSLILLHPHPGPVMNTPGAKAYRPWTPELYADQAHAPSAKLPEDDSRFFLTQMSSPSSIFPRSMPPTETRPAGPRPSICYYAGLSAAVWRSRWRPLQPEDRPGL